LPRWTPIRSNNSVEHAKLAIVSTEPTVRPMLQADIELLIAWRADRRVNEWYGGLEGATPEAIQADWDDEAWCERGIIEVNGRPIGFVQWYEADAETTAVYRLPMGPRYWGIDIFIGEPSMFGHGIGTSVVRLLSNRLLEEHLADIVVIDPHQRNKRAIRSYEKAGFTYSHDLPAHETQDGITYDAVLLTKRFPT
jgi:aminoglycoside 6'-N-acetyltransferase